MSLKTIIHAAVFGCFVGAVGIEQILWNEQSMEQTAEEKRAECEQCGSPAILIYTPGPGWVCEACDLENLTTEQNA